ncbi:MAG TPA: hypothetical protein PKO33_15805 [Pyrinomonadaceae bacterium]|nr:hypothetical protein [Pyrinomonadaceae bacterium]
MGQQIKAAESKHAQHRDGQQHPSQRRISFQHLVVLQNGSQTAVQSRRTAISAAQQILVPVCGRPFGGATIGNPHKFDKRFALTDPHKPSDRSVAKQDILN